jgi:hypothetical protein
MSTRLYLPLAAALALAGCDQINKDTTTQTDGTANPNYKQAQQDLDNNNPSAAIADYDAALAANPKLAGAHYELGVIYGDKMNDPVSSIYHFKQFIDLSPNSDKKDEVQALIDKESAVFAASLPNSGPSAADMAKLQDENASLKKEVDDASGTIAKLQAQLTKHHLVAATTPTEAPSGPLLAQAGSTTTADPSAPISTDATGVAASQGAAGRPGRGRGGQCRYAGCDDGHERCAGQYGGRSQLHGGEGRQLLEDRQEDVSRRHQERRGQDPGSEQGNHGQAVEDRTGPRHPEINFHGP